MLKNLSVLMQLPTINLEPIFLFKPPAPSLQCLQCA